MSRRSLALVSLLVLLGVALSALSVSFTAATGVDRTSVGQSFADSGTSPEGFEQTLRANAATDREGEFCEDAQGTVMPESGLCTHGSDPAPPGLDVDEPVPPLRVALTRQAMAPLSCEGDGQSGLRIQVLYVHAGNEPSRYDAFRSSIQAWAAGADQLFQDSAAETGGSRRLRFVHDASCQPVITPVQVSPAGDGSFDDTITDLKKRRYNRTDRIYLAFVDTANAGICGVGAVWSDDRPGGRVNRNNVGPSYAQVNAGCWSADIAAHELMHTLGGVQHSAPNGSGGFHCIDEWDLMCYQDRPGLPTRKECPQESRKYTRFDCNHDDYFHTNPPAGSYLATHWNAATNRFLVGARTGRGVPRHVKKVQECEGEAGQEGGGNQEGQARKGPEEP